MSPLVRRTAAVVVLAIVVVLGARFLEGGTSLTVELPDAAGIRAGDEVRVAGIKVGKVTGIAAAGSKVDMGIELDDGVPVTADTTAEVKLGSLLGQRYVELRPGDGRRLADGGTLPLANASGSYTIERFWLEGAPRLKELNLATLSRAVDVLTTDLAVTPGSARDALTGMATVASLVTRREDQIRSLLRATRAVTDEVVAQSDQVTGLMKNADKVMSMVVERRRSLDVLLAESTRLARELSSLAGENAAPMAAALTDLQKILRVLRDHRDDLGRTLELAEPAMRLYVNSSGDGPWLGVNAPYFVLPDSFWCLTRRDIGCH
ncbi:MAG: hypothetical protein JWQ74_1283 [Marmoricola sp.]|nr:hypothetical protein [Marmoricola sp.]